VREISKRHPAEASVTACPCVGQCSLNLDKAAYLTLYRTERSESKIQNLSYVLQS
jgi:hypothetical protein